MSAKHNYALLLFQEKENNVGAKFTTNSASVPYLGLANGLLRTRPNFCLFSEEEKGGIRIEAVVVASQS
jgi:hypothetical protein